LRYRRNIETALALNRRGEVRRDGLSLKNACSRLEIEWVARDIHPWDRDLPPEEKATLFVEQCLSDTEAALHRLFEHLASIDIVELRVLAPSREHAVIAGTVLRSELDQLSGLSPGMRLKQLGLCYRLTGNHFELLDAEGVPQQDALSEAHATLANEPLATALARNAAERTRNDLSAPIETRCTPIC
jgi:hypothetical protein